MVTTGSRTGTNETGRLRIDPNPLLADEIEAEQDAVQIRVRKGPMLQTADQVMKNTMRRTSHSVIGVCLVSQGNHQTGHIRESHILQQRYRCVNWTISS